MESFYQIIQYMPSTQNTYIFHVRITYHIYQSIFYQKRKSIEQSRCINDCITVHVFGDI